MKNMDICQKKERQEIKNNNKKLKIGLISDIHEDINALDWYLEYVETNDIDIGICLGDSVSKYCDDDINYFLI